MLCPSLALYPPRLPKHSDLFCVCGALSTKEPRGRNYPQQKSSHNSSLRPIAARTSPNLSRCTPNRSGGLSCPSAALQSTTAMQNMTVCTSGKRQHTCNRDSNLRRNPETPTQTALPGPRVTHGATATNSTAHDGNDTLKQQGMVTRTVATKRGWVAREGRDRKREGRCKSAPWSGSEFTSLHAEVQRHQAQHLELHFLAPSFEILHLLVAAAVQLSLSLGVCPAHFLVSRSS